MPFPKWGGLPEVTSKLSADGLKPLSVVSLSAADVLSNGVDDEFAEKHLKFIKDTSLLMKDTFEGIDNCLNASIAAANSCIYDDFRKNHGKTVEQAMQESKEALSKIQALIPNEEVASSKTVDQVMKESNEALRKIQALTTKEGNKQDNAPDDAPDDAATTVFPAWTQSKEGANTVFPSWVQPEDDKTTWWPSDGNSTADDVTTVFPAVR